MPAVVKIITDNYGEKRDSPKWHWIATVAGGSATLCDIEYFGYGESGCIYKVKDGKITCQKCIEIIKKIKAIKL